MEAKIYNKSGKEAGKVTLPTEVFDLPWNADLVHQVVVSMRSNARTPVAHTKDRGDVRGGGRKPWKQKGTGRARHGSNRSPIWKGGGVTFGPRNEKNYNKKINKKMRAKALFIVLSQKLRDGEILFVDDINLTDPKTANAKNVITSLSGISGFETLKTKKRNTAYVAVNKEDENTLLGFRNFGNIAMGDVRNLNPSGLLNFKYLIITNPDESISAISSRLSKSAKVPQSKPKTEKTVKKSEIKKVVAKKLVEKKKTKAKTVAKKK